MRAAHILLALVSFIGFAPAQEPVAHPDKLAAIEPAMRKFVESGDLSGAVTVVGRKMASSTTKPPASARSPAICRWRRTHSSASHR